MKRVVAQVLVYWPKPNPDARSTRLLVMASSWVAPPQQQQQQHAARRDGRSKIENHSYGKGGTSQAESQGKARRGDGGLTDALAQPSLEPACPPWAVLEIRIYKAFSSPSIPFPSGSHAAPEHIQITAQVAGLATPCIASCPPLVALGEIGSSSATGEEGKATRLCTRGNGSFSWIGLDCWTRLAGLLEARCVSNKLAFSRLNVSSP
ncbi:hypothetical protein V8C34DRAFT_230138 [Trichoderma compactum]